MAGQRVQRRLAAILAADVVGYSRMMEADEAGTLARLKALRAEFLHPKIAEYGGRIVNTTGDGTLVEFPSAVDAVQHAVEVQAELARRNADLPEERRIVLRIGINVGDVIIDGEDVYGDGVNLAARLEALANPGGICVSANVADQARGRLAADFNDLGEQHVKNITRPVRVFAVAAAAGTTATPPTPERSPAPRLSIVVLPFANLGGDPEQEYFVDGVTENLTTDLSRLVGSFVIGRNTAFTYKGKPTDLKRIGHELNVRYVLEGSVQRGGNRIRVNVQLIDAETGAHLWAERFDKPVSDLFDMQDEIVARLANELSTALIAQEARRTSKTPNSDSMDYYFQGMAWYEKGMSPPNVTEARRCFERALELDPGNVDALVKLANMDHIFGTIFNSDDRAARVAAAEVSLKKALSLAPNHAFGHFLMGIIHTCDGRAEEGIAEFERALELDRNLAFAHAFIGNAKFISGRSEETEAHVREALRLSPKDAFAYAWIFQAGFAKLLLGEDEEAVAWSRRSIEANSNFTLSHFTLAAALAHLGRLDEARAAAQAGLTLDPTTTIKRLRVVYEVIE
jgi:TolB-like protein/tetratricopeptide (TPR) repeat protein